MTIMELPSLGMTTGQEHSIDEPTRVTLYLTLMVEVRGL